MLLYESESDDSLSVAEEHSAKFHLKWSLLGKDSGVGAKTTCRFTDRPDAGA